jgi:hypothetical protein
MNRDLQLEEFLYANLCQVIPIRWVHCYSLAHSHPDGRRNQIVVDVSTDLKWDTSGQNISLHWPLPGDTTRYEILNKILARFMSRNPDVQAAQDRRWEEFRNSPEYEEFYKVFMNKPSE